MSKFAREKQVGLEAISKASIIAKNMQGKLENLYVVNKEDLSPVTLTDFSVQALINLHLTAAFPAVPIMGEEDSLFLRNPQHVLIKEKVTQQIEEFFPKIKEAEILEAIDKGGFRGSPKARFWVLDPIDGTRGFISNEQYAIALALIEEGEVVLSFLGCPRLSLKKFPKGGIFVAAKGEGCTFVPYDGSREQPVHVRSGDEAREITYCEPHATSKTHSHSKAFEIAKFLHAHPSPSRMDSQCKYAIVAGGDASVYLRIPVKPSNKEKIWDHAPGALIVEEAGGKVTDLDGKKLDYTHGETLVNNRGILATNGALHDLVLEAIAKTNAYTQ